MSDKLKPCPFCGSEAVVKVDQEDHGFQIVGCDTPENMSMLCPSPMMAVYKNESGEYDYRNWNHRPIESALVEALKELLDAEWMVSHDWGGDRQAVIGKAKSALASAGEM